MAPLCSGCTLGHQYFLDCRIWSFLQELARHLYTAVDLGIMDGAKVQNTLHVTRADAFKGEMMIMCIKVIPLSVHAGM